MKKTSLLLTLALVLATLPQLLSAETSAVPVAPDQMFLRLPPNAGALSDVANGQALAPRRRKSMGLSHWVLREAFRVGAKINRTGGYRFDGRNDCYGFLRRVWNPILEFYHHAGKISRKELPVDDYVSPAWQPISRLRGGWNGLKPGDVLATAQGHHWGANWHCGLYYGKVHGHQKIFDNSGCGSGRCGAYVRDEVPGMFRYYYVPTHKLLLKYDR